MLCVTKIGSDSEIRSRQYNSELDLRKISLANFKAEQRN